MWSVRATLALTACVSAFSLFAPIAQAGNSKVNCNSPGANGKITNVLNRLNPVDANTVRVSGHCHENLVIRGFDRLSLVAEPGTTIEDASGGQAPVVDIEDSKEVILQDFTIQGGNDGVYCWDFSFCRLIRLKVEQTAGGDGGVVVINSQGQLIDSTIQDSRTNGMVIFGGKLQWRNVIVSNAQNNGVIVNGRSQLNGPNDTVTGSGQLGITVQGGSNANVNALTVTRNAWGGIQVTQGSTASLGSMTVTDNQGSGLSIQESNVTIYNSVVADNHLGGIFEQWESSLNLADTTVMNNGDFGLSLDQLSFAWIGSGTLTGQATDLFCGQQVAVVQIDPGVVIGNPNCPQSLAAARAAPVVPRPPLPQFPVGAQ